MILSADAEKRSLQPGWNPPYISNLTAIEIVPERLKDVQKPVSFGSKTFILPSRNSFYAKS
jgi:hypothetical protein